MARRPTASQCVDLVSCFNRFRDFPVWRRVRPLLGYRVGRVLTNARIASGYALTLRLRRHWYWYFWLTVVQKMHPGRGNSVQAMLVAAAVVHNRGADNEIEAQCGARCRRMLRSGH